VITSKAAATIWRGVEAAFTHLRTSGYDLNLLTALAAEEVPDFVTDAFRSDYWKAQATFFTFSNGRWFKDRDADVAGVVLAELKASTPIEVGQELLRRFANAARSEFVRLAQPLPWARNRTMRALPFE